MGKGYIGNTFRMPLTLAGFQHNRNTDLMVTTALIQPSANIDFHEGGIGKRAGTAVLASGFGSEIRGIYQFRKRNKNSFFVYYTSQGAVYQTAVANAIASGMSQSNFPSFSVFNDELYIADGGSTPRYWDGNAALMTAVTPATSWASTNDQPFQMVTHARGANSRLWAITRAGVWAGPNNDGHDFSGVATKQIPVYSEDGLVGAFDFGGRLFVWSNTKCFIIDDQDDDPSLWGYHEAQWEGGVAHFRLIVKAGNNLFLMTQEGLIYSLGGIQATGEYESVALNRPAHVDRWIRENVTLSNIDKCHATYDRARRAIVYFLPIGGANPNTGLTYFIDRPPEIAWVPHNNSTAASGFNAMCSAEARIDTGRYQVITGDASGKAWKLGMESRADNALAYRANFKTIRIDMGNPRLWKRFGKLRMRVRAQGNFNLTVRWWVDGNRKTDRTLSLSGSGAMFDSALFDSAVFSEDALIPVEVDLGDYGFDVQFEVLNENANEDFFASELMVDFEPCEIR